MIEIINDYPPNYSDIAAAFKLKGKEIFAYDGKIYSPISTIVPVELIEHEKVHFAQQKNVGLLPWWDKYLKEAEFRLEQELEAHLVEYKIFCRLTKDRNIKAKYMDKMAVRLSSSIYGNMITYSKVLKRLKNGT